MPLHLNESIETYLKRFGFWVGSQRIGTEYPCFSAGIMGAVPDYFHIAPLADDEAMEVDRYLQTMYRVDKKLCLILILKFVHRKTVREICHKLEIDNETEYRRQLAIAKTSIKMMICQNECIMLA